MMKLTAALMGRVSLPIPVPIEEVVAGPTTEVPPAATLDPVDDVLDRVVKV
jgi:hypothetical protein